MFASIDGRVMAAAAIGLVECCDDVSEYVNDPFRGIGALFCCC